MPNPLNLLQVILIAVFLLIVSCAREEPELAKPPVAERVEKVLFQHEHQRTDPYYWMRTDPVATDAYIEAEESYLATVMADTRELQSRLIAEMNSRLVASHRSVPTRIGDYYYYREYRKGGQYPVYLRSSAGEGDPEILLDLNDLAGAGDYYQLGGFSISPDQNLIAFTEDTKGDQLFTLRIRNLADNVLLPFEVEDVGGGVAWSASGDSVYYVQSNDASFKPRVVRQRSLEQLIDEIVYQENDPAFHIELFETPNEGQTLLSIINGNTVEYRLIDETGQLETLLPRQIGQQSSIRLNGDDVYVLTDLDAPGYRLIRTVRGESANPGNWEKVYTPPEGTTINNFAVFEDRIVVSETVDLKQQIRVIDLINRTYQLITFRNPLANVSLQASTDPTSNSFRYRYSSPTAPEKVVEYEFAAAQAKTLSESMVSPGYQPTDYVSERRWFESRDGVRIPVSLMYKKYQELSQKPAYLSAYGAYGISTTLEFDPKIITLLDHGFVYGVIHVRGGGELGSDWHAQGKLLNKKNSFNDFIDGTRFLMDEGIIDPEKAIARGSSAGGLIMGVIANEAPDLYQGIVAQMPFVDVVTTMSDDSIPMTVGEYSEWGNPADPDYYHYLLSYSPYDQVKKQVYPGMLIMAARNDTRVPFYEPLKWLAKLRANNLGNNLLLIDMAENTGHRGPSDQLERRRRDALELAFVIRTVSDQED